MTRFAGLATRLRAAAQSLTGPIGALQARLGKTTPSHKKDDLAEADWRGEDAAENLGAFPEDARVWAQPKSADPSGDPSAFAAGSYLEDPGYDGQGLLSVHNLAKAYKSRRVVEDVSLHVARGEAVGLLGPNGAGKTTVFYMITGLVKPDKGVVSLDGYDVTPLPMYRRARLGIGYLPQETSVFRGLSVEDNILAVLEITQPDEKKRKDELEGLLDEFRLTRMRHTPAVALSGGERRRCEIARALAGHPSFMLLDEPFAGIDPIAVGGIQDLVRHLKARGIGVLITDHSVRETLGLTDRAYIIYNGHVLTEGRPEEIVANPDVRRIYLGEDFRM
ncbi:MULTISPECIES: LPS export ABC transporter ATP-binding protein [unclassified Methylocystis]|uniref:LPS export ABC transporter ATP-binding protein n=1 Tax=unclassified Methylocystis TaxID=2625913 RepID=UPI001924BB45|nr:MULTISPECIES: LPS export ABC transporter ATP-binding protein [unclassified Methylocystis]MBL1255439.1 LPS export ABC transporter ATP-binding protein [Methylocystis sp. Sn-Cys]MDJ0449730.1 LPS export ABC transporter ATP-binding protein [Methylocystis sp. JR02]